MADTTIETILRLKDQLSGPLRSVGSGIAATARQINGLNDQLRQASSTALGMKGQVAGALAGIGVGIGFKEILDLSSNFEDTALSIAGNIKAFNLAPTFEASRKAAEDALNTIDALAAKLPGEADAYIQVFKTALPKAIESGLGSVKEVADFTSKFTAVAVSNQIDAMQAGMDLMRMLGGQAGLDVRTWTALNPHLKVTKDIMKELGGRVKGLQVGAGLTAEAFNRLSATTRRELIQGAIGKFDEQMVAAGDTFSAKMGEITSRVKKLIRLASEPMFDAAKDALSKINDYLERNGDRLKKTLGEFFQKAAEYGPKIVDTLKWALDHAEDIKDYMVDAAYVWAGSSFISTLNNGLQLALGIRAAMIAAAGAQIGGAAGAGGSAATNVGVGALLGRGAGAARAVAGSTLGLAATAGYFLYGSMDEAEDDRLKALRERMEDERKMMDLLLEPSKLSPDYIWPAKRSALRTPAGRSGAPYNDYRHSRFNIKQEFSEGFDPDRIAVAFSQDLARVGEMKLQAARNVQAGFVR